MIFQISNEEMGSGFKYHSQKLIFWVQQFKRLLLHYKLEQNMRITDKNKKKQKRG